MSAIIVPLILVAGLIVCLVRLATKTDRRKNRNQSSSEVLSVRSIYLTQLFLFLVFALFTPFLIYKHFLFNPMEPSAGVRYFFGNLFAVVALIVVIINLYKLVLRPTIHKLRFGSFEIYEPARVVPLTGSLYVIFSTLIYPPSVLFGIFALTLYLVDPASLVWHVFKVIKLVFITRFGTKKYAKKP